MRKSAVFLAASALACMTAGIGYAADVGHGKEVFTAEKCSMCHSIAGKGNSKNPLDGVGSKLKDAEIKKWIKTPKEMKADAKMKAYPNLSEKDLDDLTAYLLTLKK